MRTIFGKSCLTLFLAGIMARAGHFKPCDRYSKCFSDGQTTAPVNNSSPQTKHCFFVMAFVFLRNHDICLMSIICTWKSCKCSNRHYEAENARDIGPIINAAAFPNYIVMLTFSLHFALLLLHYLSYHCITSQSHLSI